MMLGYLEFTNLVWAWGLPFAVGVPLLAHLWKRYGGRTVVFPGVRFLHEAVVSQSRRSRPINLTLLLLRVMVLVLIVGAFTGPVWRATWRSDWADDGMVAAIVLDRSASMLQPYRGGTLFDHAKRRVIDALSELDPQRDLAVVVMLDAAPSLLWPELSANFSRLISLVEQTQPTYQRGDLDRAVQLAIDQLDRVGVYNADSSTGGGQISQATRIDLYTDAQKTMVPEDFSSRSAWMTRVLRVHRVGDGNANFSIFEPVMTPVRPIVGQRATVTVSVANYNVGAPSRSPSESTRVAVHLIEGGDKQTQSVDVPVNTVGSVSFTIYPRQAGWASVELMIEPHTAIDIFPYDDRTGISFMVAKARKVSLITRADVDDAQVASFYVARALSPVFGQDAESDVELRIGRPDQIENHVQHTIDGHLSADAVVIVEAGQLDRMQLELLYRYTLAGGALIWVVDSSDAVGALEVFADLYPKLNLSSMVWREPGAWETDVGGHLAVVDTFFNPILKAFEGPSLAALTRLSFRDRVRLTGRGEGGSVAGVLLTFDDGLPALVSQWIGSGRLAVWAWDLSPENSDMVKGSLFVPLLHELLRGLSPGPLAPPIPHPGDAPTVELVENVAGQQLLILGPSGESVGVKTISMSPRHTTVQLNTIVQPGRYVVAAAGRSELASIYAELDPLESDLRQVTNLREIPAGRRESLVKWMDASEGRGEYSQDIHLWPYFVVLAVFLMVLENLAMILIQSLMGDPAMRIKLSMLDWLNPDHFVPPMGFELTVLLLGIAAVAIVWQSLHAVPRPRLGVAWVLLILRLVGLGLVAWLLAGPGGYESQEGLLQRIPVIFLADTSSSMAQRDVLRSCGPTIAEGDHPTDTRMTRWQSVVEDWLNSDLVDRLHDRGCAVRLFTFDSQTRAMGFDEVRNLREPKGISTDLFSAIEQVVSFQPDRSFEGQQRPGVVVLLSDGHDTRGDRASALADRLGDVHWPVMSVPVGVVQDVPDLAVAAWSESELLYEGQTTWLEAVVAQTGFEDRRVQVDLMHHGEVIQSQQTESDGQPNVRFRFQIKAPVAPGQTMALLGYRVTAKLLPVENHERENQLFPMTTQEESVTANNTRWVFVPVVKERIRVAMFEGQPYWDTRALARVLRQDPRFDLTAVYGLGLTRSIVTDEASLQPDGLPSQGLDQQLVTEGDLERYDVVVLGKSVEHFFP